MSVLICPHCRTQVPRGATVCTGCHAEVKYGPANGLYGAAFLAGAFAGFMVGHGLPESLSFVGWVVGALVFGGLSYLVNKVWADRVVFHRVYRTR